MYEVIIDYEYLILNQNDEDNMTDECVNCPYKGEICNNECLEVIEIYNPYIKQVLKEV